MPIYLMLTTLTEKGVQTLNSNPARVREVNRDVEELGARVLHQWASLGEYDFVKIVEEIKTTKADMIINTIDGSGNLAFFRALRNAGITPEKVPTVWASLSEVEAKMWSTGAISQG